jgi:hypothetical protein
MYCHGLGYANTFIQSNNLEVKTMENTKTTEIMSGVMLAEDEHAARGKLAQWVRLHILDGHYDIVGSAYGYLESKHGKRKNTKAEQTPSTPADSMRACIHNVTSALIGHEKYHAEGALKPVKVGDEWGLEDKGVKTPKTVKVEKVCAKFASQFKTEETKKAALIATARAMGIEINF